MSTQDPPSNNRPPASASGATNAGVDEFALACDWGENWGRIALINQTTGAELLIVVPFPGNTDMPPEKIEQKLCELARPHLNKAVRALIARSWQD